MTAKKLTVSALIVFQGLLIYGQTIVQKTNDGYLLLRDGNPYYVKGVGGDGNFDKMVSIGANSFRTWGVDNAQKLLEEAQKRGLTVMLGLWMQPERHGFDYDNAESVKKQLDYLKTVVNQFKDYPALLMWGVGNELDLEYTNPNVWNAVEDLAQYIHTTDPNHPTCTVTAGLHSAEVQYIKSRCPSIDVFGINTYGDIGNVPKNIAEYGWTGPYIITEWGPNGHWESPQTEWGVSLEQTSTEKKEVYYNRYKNYIEPNKNYCLGSYAFLWGSKQEYTPTWYGLFSKENIPTESIDALQELYTGTKVANPSASIVKLSMGDKMATDNVTIKAEDKYNAEVIIKTDLDAANKKIKYVWRIMEETAHDKSGGDAEMEATEIMVLIKKGKSGNRIVFRAPKEAGIYRLFVSVIYNGKMAYGNIPFKVVNRSKEDKQSSFIKFKYTDMKSFEQ